MSLPNRDVMMGRGWVILLLQTLLISCAVVAAISDRVEWSAIVSLSLLGIGIVAFQWAPRLRIWSADRGVASSFSVLVWLSLLLTTMLWNIYFALMAALISAMVAVASRQKTAASRKTEWKILVIVWLALVNLIWLWTGYEWNIGGLFYSGLLSILILLILCRMWFRIHPAGVQIVNTFVLLLAGLPVAGLIYQFHDETEIRPETFSNYYSYEKAKGDPAAFARAQEYFMGQYTLLGKKIFEPFQPVAPSLRQRPTQRGYLAWPTLAGEQANFRLRPHSRGYLMQCPISINSQGFRGPEISEKKGNVYRIVALGESTTFGMTFGRDDKTWPELLEQIIRERLKTRRPVEVINAGVPAYTLCDNLLRLSGQILPLQPDMIISYHGANGFYLIDETLLRPLGEAPPHYEERPLKLAADFEYRIKLLLFRNRERPKPSLDKPTFDHPMETKYANAYRRLIEFAAKNGIRLMLANYSMPVNEKSDSAVIDFYQGAGGDAVHGRITANEVHSLILEQLAAQHPEVCLIDTHPHLDGDPQKFTDLMHLTQEGRRQLAENIFAGIRKALVEDIGR
jgi:lysophospholipase L1-like esterase